MLYILAYALPAVGPHGSAVADSAQCSRASSTPAGLATGSSSTRDERPKGRERRTMNNLIVGTKPSATDPTRRPRTPVKRPAFEWLNEQSRAFLSSGYLLLGTSPEQRVRHIAQRAEELLPGMDGFADKFYDYMSRGWYSLASPVWSNFGLARGLPISCYGSYVPDSMDGILQAAGEVGMMSKYGGGTSAYFGDLRGRGSPITDNGQSE